MGTVIYAGTAELRARIGTATHADTAELLARIGTAIDTAIHADTAELLARIGTAIGTAIHADTAKLPRCGRHSFQYGGTATDLHGFRGFKRIGRIAPSMMT